MQVPAVALELQTLVMVVGFGGTIFAIGRYFGRQVLILESVRNEIALLAATTTKHGEEIAVCNMALSAHIEDNTRQHAEITRLINGGKD